MKAVVPLLQSRCVNCHNSIDRKGSFSVQKREEVLESGFVVPGKPDDSELLGVLVSQNGSRPAMPKTGSPLTAEEVETVRAWITAGAHWPEGFEIEEPVISNTDWWSFRPIIRPEIPDSKASHPIDHFIHAALKARKLTPSPPAEPRVLIRRLYFDLIGLPPSPEEVEQFVAESEQESASVAPSAYERLVDRLLESPQYGERWARHWLDVVKYADTCGYDKDKLRPNAWPYRDYVVRSLNEDKPYSRFVQEQIAGDVLFPGTPDGILGLGFIAAGPWDWIGHAEVPESKIDGKVARHTDRDEMVSNTLNTFCSVTIQCCQCHNHKFDPFTQEHYYNLQSVFAAVDKAERAYDVDPQIEKHRLKLNEQLKSARAALSALNSSIQKEGGPELAEIEKSISELKPKARPTSIRPEYGYHSEMAPRNDVEKWVRIDLGREVNACRIVLRPCHDDFNNIGAGFGFPVRFRVTGGPSTDTMKILHEATQSDVPNPALVPYEIQVTDSSLRFVQVTATVLAPRQNDFIFALAELQVFDQNGENAGLNATVSALDSIEAPDRWRKSNLTDGIWPGTPADESAFIQLTEAQKKRQIILDRVLTSERAAERDRLNKEISSIESELSAQPVGKLVYAAATHFTPIASFLPTNGRPREIHLLHRGNVLQPLAPSVPGTLPNLVPADSTLSETGHFRLSPDHSEGDRRAALAQWITRHDHPLTWRSIVNRIWQHHFGRGLVETSNDFGRMGHLPTHPELLDWLAAEFRDNGQSWKTLHRLI
ncbi:MAG: PSD1 and planctomycete cytochrome C domain-containing protein, partial [Planctomyces sp.]